MVFQSEVIICVLLLQSDIIVNGYPSTEYYTPGTTVEPQNEITTKSSLIKLESEDYSEEDNSRQARGMMMDDHGHDHDHPEPMMQQKAVAEDPWASYYDFIINEGSFKFWAVFQLLTALLLIYSAVAAAYYAKFNVITTDYDYYDDFFARSNNESPASSIWSGLSSSTFQRIFDAISSKKYT